MFSLFGFPITLYRGLLAAAGASTVPAFYLIRRSLTGMVGLSPLNVVFCIGMFLVPFLLTLCAYGMSSMRTHEELNLTLDRVLPCNRSLLIGLVSEIVVSFALPDFLCCVVLSAIFYLLLYRLGFWMVNPWLLLFRHHLYLCGINEEKTVLILTNQHLENGCESHMGNLRRVDDFNFLDLGEKQN